MSSKILALRTKNLLHQILLTTLSSSSIGSAIPAGRMNLSPSKIIHRLTFVYLGIDLCHAIGEPAGKRCLLSIAEIGLLWSIKNYQAFMESLFSSFLQLKTGPDGDEKNDSRKDDVKIDCAVKRG